MGLPQPLEMTGRSLAEGHAWSRGAEDAPHHLRRLGPGAGDEGDAIHLAHTPYWDAFWKIAPGAACRLP